MNKPIIGQEAICPDGLGRVIAFDFDSPNKQIIVSTYIKDRKCCWSADNVKLIPIPEMAAKDIHDQLQTIISQLDQICIYLRDN